MRPISCRSWDLSRRLCAGQNPDLWTPAVFASLARMAREDATFATFTGAGMVKRALVEHGFDYRKVTGFGGKRAMLVGRRAELLSVTAS